MTNRVKEKMKRTEEKKYFKPAQLMQRKTPKFVEIQVCLFIQSPESPQSAQMRFSGRRENSFSTAEVTISAIIGEFLYHN